jgi:hypothetical protein
VETISKKVSSKPKYSAILYPLEIKYAMRNSIVEDTPLPIVKITGTFPIRSIDPIIIDIADPINGR